ncbi:MAG TPA: GyrI-like domain-containing protein [Streptosporangiaceae bacterium]|nr:GyrI-like domain-containing protein [Streptosporangiaceae bacterium]
MAIEVRIEQAAPRRLAAIRSVTTPQDLQRTISRSLGIIWPAVREQGVRFGHNVFVYHNGELGTLLVELGVEVFGDFTEGGDIQIVQTPPGEVATATYYGDDYTQMAPVYQALEQWCASNGRRAVGVNWEVYGDPAEDPAQTRTDLYFLLEPAAG